MADQQFECRGFLGSETPRSMFVKKHAADYFGHYVPRSQVGYLRKTKLPDGSTEIVFTLPEWLIEKMNIWEFTT